MKKTKQEIAKDAKKLADALSGWGPGLVGSTLRELALLIHDLASLPPVEVIKPARRRK